MTTLEIEYHVKFRAFGMTFGTISGKRRQDIPGMFPKVEIFNFNDRGLKITLKVV